MTSVGVVQSRVVRELALVGAGGLNPPFSLEEPDRKLAPNHQAPNHQAPNHQAKRQGYGELSY